MKIFFTRHGESEANILRELSNRGLKHPLTQAGREQAAIIADTLRDQTITHIYSSPLLRAIETSIIIATVLRIGYEVNDALREYDLGALEGRVDEEAWNQWQRIFDSWSKHQRREEKIPGGENFHEVRDRFVPFIDRLVQEHKNNQANLLIVSHGGLYAHMLPLVLKNISSEFILKRSGFAYTEVIIAELINDRLVCTEWGGVKLPSDSKQFEAI